jgi:glycosyltransferase involved in cell wall biosynthesis
MKLAVYAIAKNESKHVARWYESVKDADEIVVLDTGSTDDTVQLLKDLGVKVVQAELEPFRFDVARNAALNAVSPNADYCMFLDMDEVLDAGSIDTIRSAISDHSMYVVNLVFSTNSDGSPSVWYPREAIHKRTEFYWHYPVHEVLMGYSNTYSHERIEINVYHLPDTEKDRSSYVNLLEMAVDENPDDPRCAQYLGREYYYDQRWLDAIMWLRRHIDIETYGPFRSESASYISQCYLAMEGKLESALDEAESWGLRAVSEFNSAREPYCELANLYFSCGEYECAIGMLRSALRIKEQPSINMIHNADYYGSWPHHLLAACYFNIGNIEKARESFINTLNLTTETTLSASLLEDASKILGLDNVDNIIQQYSNKASGEGSVPKEVQ